MNVHFVCWHCGQELDQDTGIEELDRQVKSQRDLHHHIIASVIKLQDDEQYGVGIQRLMTHRVHILVGEYHVLTSR